MVITDGPVDPRSRLFVGRREELKTLQSWLASTDCVGAVMGARQTGKTSLLLKLRHTLRRKYAFAFVDLQSVEGADVGECFAYIAAEIRGQLEGHQAPDVSLPGNSREFLAFLRELSNGLSSLRLILILDELGALPPATAMKLASTIRALFTSRLIRPEYARYVVLLAGASDMLELTTGRNSPLRNVTESIYLGDLTLTETELLLIEVLGRARVQGSPELSRHLHGWTSGHPYWTQLLTGALQGLLGELGEAHVADLIEELLPLEDKNLPHVFKLLKDDEKLWNVIEMLLDGRSLAFSRANPAVARLELIGVVKNRDGQCAIRNRIYQEVLQRAQLKPKRFTPRDLRRLSQLLAEQATHDSLFRITVEELRLLLQIRSVAIVRITSDRLNYSLIASAGLRDPTATATFSTQGRIASMLESAFDPALAAVSETELRQLRELGSVLIVPMRQSGHPIGFFSLGRKLSNEAYDQHDVEFVAAVSEQLVACAERIQLLEIERDAEQARAIQEQLLPKTIPQIAGVEIAAGWQPARIVGGDYYDVLKIASEKLAVCIGDVVGKGMPAALMMANVQAGVRALASEEMSPQSLCRELNRLIHGNVAPGKFITFFYAIVDGGTRQFVYTNAGHNHPILLRANREILRLQVGGMVLGVFPEWSYQQEVVKLYPGDRLLLFTDGASEVWNSKGEEFCEEGLIGLLSENYHLSARDLQAKILQGVSVFCGGNFADDVTVVVLACQ